MKSTALITLILCAALSSSAYAGTASNNIPLDSPIYSYIDKLAGYGLIQSDFSGIKPFTRSEAARMLKEAEAALGSSAPNSLATEMIAEMRRSLGRELYALENPGQTVASVVNPISEAKFRYIYLDGKPRNYEREVHDPGGEGVFGIGAGLRPTNPKDFTVWQRGTEGTPLFENNEGTRYADGSSVDIRLVGEAGLGRSLTMLLEPQFLSTDGVNKVRLNKGYAKLGGGAFELEVGRDANWFGFGKRGAITLSNNGTNFDLVKMSSPEPVDAGFLGTFKYAAIFSRFDSVQTDRGERRPYFYALKASLKPVPELEIGLNLGRQQGGPGVDNSVSSYFKGLVGGTRDDNSNSLGGLEMKWRVSGLRNSELYVEYSGEDAAKFWPIVESYLAGIYVPRLTSDGRNDLRLEYFQGNRILYTHTQFSEGYMYEGMPIGHSQGGATQDYLLRYSHWLSPRTNAGIDLMHTLRGNLGRIAGQAIERKNAIRLFCNLPMADRFDLRLQAGTERITNMNLVDGVNRNNTLALVEMDYHY